MALETTGVLNDRTVQRLFAGRYIALVVSTLATLADYVFAFEQPASVATTLSIPLSLLTTIIAAYGFGMRAGIAAAGVVGLGSALLSNPTLALPFVSMEMLFGALVGRMRDLDHALRERKFAEARREAHHRALTDFAMELVLVFDANGNVTYASPSHAALMGRLPSAMLGVGFHDALGPFGVGQLTDAFARTTPGCAERLEISARHTDGSQRSFEGTLRNCLADAAVKGFVFNARDVSDRKTAESLLVEASTHDALTGLPNRAFMCARVDEALASRGGDGVAVLFIDLDRFRDVNDVLGHQYGDALLREVAVRLRAAVRDFDLVGRIGGDEFVVMLLRTRDFEEVNDVAERIRAAIVAPYALAGRDIVVRASVGIAHAGLDFDATALLRHADVAMHAAKRRRNGVAVFSKLHDERAVRRLTMASALHSAIDKDELVLHFQPQVDVRTGDPRGAEALVRWEHPERGLLYPDYFLPIAEEIGEMDRMTDWILRAAIKRVRLWNRSGHRVRIAVNLSAHDLRDDRLAEVVPRMLANYGVSPASLCLELTETTVMTEAESAANCLRGLSERGVRISIDDFGTGYSAIAHLRQFPVDEIKIDKQFVLNMESDPEDAAIVASTIDLAHRLSVDVVVEGVERTSTLDLLRRMGAEYAQGYAISRPLTATAFDIWMTERRGLRAVATG